MENKRFLEDRYFLNRFERDIQILFDEVSKSIHVHKVNILKANKNLKCDYFIPLQSSEHLRQNIDVIVKKLKSISYISDAGMDSNLNLTMKLKRNMVFEAVLGEISAESSQYGYLNKKKSVLVFVNFVRSKSLENMRNCLLAEHVVTILANNGMIVFHNDFQTKKLLNHSNITRLECSDKYPLDIVSKELEDNVKLSEYKCELENNKFSINLKRFIIEKNLQETYGNSVTSIVLSHNSMSEGLKTISLIKHLIKDHIKYSPDVIIHIGSQGQNKNILEGGVLLNMLGCKSSQVYIFSHSVSYKSALDTEFSQFCSVVNSDLQHSETKSSTESNFPNSMANKTQESEGLAELFVKAYHQVIENSTAMKYESYDSSHKSWSSRIQSLTDAAVKFDFLSQSYSLNLVLLPPSDRGSPKTSGVFIQYNHARLSNLFRNFDAMVSDGTYASLCNLDSADLTLLSHEVEWQLLNILASFPQMVDEVVDSLLGESGKGRIQTSRIPVIMRELCRLLSLYYGKVRVLCGPQMQRHVHARMWLMKGVHQVLHNGLALMNIQGMDLM